MGNGIKLYLLVESEAHQQQSHMEQLEEATCQEGVEQMPWVAPTARTALSVTIALVLRTVISGEGSSGRSRP